MGLIEQLLAEISQSEKNAVKAGHAFHQLCKLYGSVVHGACGYICQRFDIKRKEDREDLEQEVWIKIFLSAKTYNPKPYTTPKEEEKRFFNWVTSIVKNVKLQEIRKKRISLNTYDQLPNDLLVDVVPMETEQPKTLHELLEEETLKILHELDELESEVMFTTLEHSPNKVPTSEIKRIAQRFKTSSANVRQIRRRILARITKLILDKNLGLS